MTVKSKIPAAPVRARLVRDLTGVLEKPPARPEDIYSPGVATYPSSI